MTNQDWQPTARFEVLELRANILRQIRDFFAERNVLEVETPVLSESGNSDPGLQQFCLDSEAGWLRTSPEYAMKRLLAAGSGDIYELGRVFRSGEQGRHHNREFTMLEWYRCGWTHHQLMDEVAELVRGFFTHAALNESRISYQDLFLAYAGIDPHGATLDELQSCADSFGLDVPDLDRDGLLDLILSHVIQPRMKKQDLVFVYDYPESQAALAQITKNVPAVAERFELFVNGLELANGYHELCDPIEQRQRFDLENKCRQSRSLEPVPIDEKLLAALEAGLPQCSGVAVGVDRLIMLLSGNEHLAQVIPFPASRA